MPGKKKPPIFDYAGYDTLIDSMEHLNTWGRESRTDRAAVQPEPGTAPGARTAGHVDAGNTGRLSYFWNFGDGSYGRGLVVTHTYAFSDVKLVAVDGHGRVGTYRQAGRGRGR